MKRFATAPFATGLLIGSIFFSVIVSAWSAPTLAPPNGNASAPVNLSATAQSKTGSLGVGGLAVFGNTALQGTTAATNEISVAIGSQPGQYRMTAGNYGAFFRNDGANTYFLLTASGDQNGSWNALRPLYINDGTGQVNIDTGLTVRGTGITYPDGTVQATAAKGTIVTTTSRITNCAQQAQANTCPAGYTVSSCGFSDDSYGGGAPNNIPGALYVSGNGCYINPGGSYSNCISLYTTCIKIQ